ncbi:MAG: acyl-CoA dehydrogenase family protein [Solirubrobacteraceae bacterium]
MVADLPKERPPTHEGTSLTSFSKALALGEIHEDLVFPYPVPRTEEADRARVLIQRFRDYAAAKLNPTAIDRDGWIADEIFQDLGDLGLMGLYVDREYGGGGFSQTAYARIFEALAEAGGSLGVAMGVHQSIGMKGISIYGSEEQKQRLLPDLCSGRKLAAFALTEPHAGSDAFNIESRAVQQRDGSWLLNGEKRFIGNGGRGSVFVTFARTEIDGKDRHTAFILERGMDGFEAGDRYDTMGLRGNDLRPLYFHDVRVPPENVLGEPGQGFGIAMQVLNNGRLSLGASCVGLAKQLLDLAIGHVKERHQFNQRLADFDLVKDKVGWMVSYLFGLESTCYLTTGLVDAGIRDYSIESAICKVAGTEFVWYQANRAMQLKGGEGYLRSEPYELIMRDIRIFPIFEGANDVLRSYIALSALKPLGHELEVLADADLSDPIRLLGAFTEDVLGRVRRAVHHPDRLTRTHGQLAGLADPVGEQVKRLRQAGEGLLRRYGPTVSEHGMQHKRLAAALADIYSQVAVLSRVTSILDEPGPETSAAQERQIAETFCARAARRVNLALDDIERNDDERTQSIADLAYDRGAYGYALLGD